MNLSNIHNLSNKERIKYELIKMYAKNINTLMIHIILRVSHSVFKSNIKYKNKLLKKLFNSYTKLYAQIKYLSIT